MAKDIDTLFYPIDISKEIGISSTHINALKRHGCKFFGRKTTIRWVREHIAKLVGATTSDQSKDHLTLASEAKEQIGLQSALPTSVRASVPENLDNPDIQAKMTVDKQIQDIEFEKVRRRVDAGNALTLKQLAVYTGYSYSTVTNWPKRKDSPLPLLNGRVFVEDFILWRARVTGLETAPDTARPLPSSQRPSGRRRPSQPDATGVRRPSWRT